MSAAGNRLPREPDTVANDASQDEFGGIEHEDFFLGDSVEDVEGFSGRYWAE